MTNISKKIREKNIEFINKLREEFEDNEKLILLNSIEKALSEKKFGLVWEEHEERVDLEIEKSIPLFKEINDREINEEKNTQSTNFLIEGDNLHSLYLLEKTHKNKIDIIYIDPPYNTGKKDFVYNDTYVDTEDSYRHSKWLSFMSKRLRIAQKLLSKDGVIYISIDDHEYSQLKILCDDIFNESNYLGTIIQNKMNAKNDTLNIQRNHEYILVYRKQINYLGKKVKPTIINKKYKEKKVIFDGERYYYLGDQITTRGEGGTLNARQNLGYTVYYHPETNDKIAVCDYDVELAKTSNDFEEIYTDNEDLINQGYIPIRPPKVRGKLGAWTWDLNKFNREKDLIEISASKKTSFTVKKRTFVDVNQVLKDGKKLIYYKPDEGNSRSILDFSTNDGTTELTQVIGESGIFNNPKNLSMIKYLLNLHPNKNATVLDFFAGSGTTGQAVLELNFEDKGQRKFILCTNNQNDICEKVTYRRLKNTILGYEYTGNKSTVLYEKEISLTDLSNIDEYLSEAEEVKSSSSDDYEDIEIKFNEGMLKVIAYREFVDKVPGIAANLKYYVTDYVNKFVNNEDESTADKLIINVRELVQLENLTSISNNENILILTDEEMDILEYNVEKLGKCKRLYIFSQVLLTKAQENLINKYKIDVISVPEYYFKRELREVGEL